MADSNLQLQRKGTVLGQFTRFSIQSFPSLPASFLARFPELKVYEDDKKKWLDNLNAVLSQTLSAPKT